MTEPERLPPVVAEGDPLPFELREELGEGVTLRVDVCVEGPEGTGEEVAVPLALRE